MNGCDTHVRYAAKRESLNNVFGWSGEQHYPACASELFSFALKLTRRATLLQPRARRATRRASNENPIHEFALPAITGAPREPAIYRA